jgi:hypothetical protein
MVRDETRHSLTERVLNAEVVDDAILVQRKTIRLQWQKWRQSGDV